MYPRLKLMQKLLSDDGVIFISIDDNELYNLKLISDEIFGSNCFVADISWQRTYSKRNDSKGIAPEVEHIVVYSKTPNWQPNKLERTDEMNSNYSSPDGDEKLWSSVTINAPGAATHTGMVYAIQHPITGELMYPPNGRCWSLGQPQMFEAMSEWAEYELKDIGDYSRRSEICNGAERTPDEIFAIMLKTPGEETYSAAYRRYKEGEDQIRPWPSLYFTSKGKGGIRRKQYLEKSTGRVPSNFWPHTEVGHTGEAKTELAAIFDGKIPFDTPKPTRFIEQVIRIATKPDAIVLDAFAGSGTTAHAVLNVNKQDGGSRKFILIESMDYAEDITAERVRKVIWGFGTKRNRVEGIDSDYDYFELGKNLFTEENYFNEEIDSEKYEDYIWYSETRCQKQEQTKPYYLGSKAGTAYYFYFEKEQLCILDYSFLAKIDVKESSYVIYADKCSLTDDELRKMNITFKKIPRDIMKF